MGAANSSNVAESVSDSVMDFNTSISTSASASQSSSNTAEQYCSNTRIVAKDGASVEVCNSNVKQTISSSQLNENIQQAQVKNKAFSELQQKMDQAARSTVSGFNFGNFSNASNALRQAMSVSTSISNDIAQNCNTENSSINKAFQKCDNTDIEATGKDTEVRACSMDVIQDQIMKQVASCSQEAAASNTAVHKLKQEASQSAVAETKGFDMLAAIIVAIIVGGIILLASINTFKQLLKPAKLLMIAGAASMVGAIILLIIYLVLNGKLKEQLPPMLTTGFPSDREFFNPVGMSRQNIRNFKEICGSAHYDSTNYTESGNEVSDSVAEQQCMNDKRSSLCTWDYIKGCVVSKKELVGYPMDKLPNVTPKQTNEKCQKNEDCAGWRWDLSDALKKTQMGIKTSMLPDKPLKSSCPTDPKTKLPTDPNCHQFSHEECNKNDAYCTLGCDPEKNPQAKPTAEEGTVFADVRDACGVKLDQNGKRVLLTDKNECNNRTPFTTAQGCTIPGCYWDDEKSQCFNRGGAEKKKWQCKSYNCLACNQQTPRGIGVLYRYDYDGLPTIEAPKWSNDMRTKYATGDGAGGTMDESDKDQLRCGAMYHYGAVKLHKVLQTSKECKPRENPSEDCMKKEGLDKEGIAVTAYASGGLGALAVIFLGVGIFMLIKATKKRSIVEKITGKV